MKESIREERRRTMEKFINIVGLLLLIVSVTMADENSNTNGTGTSGAKGCKPSVCTSRDCVIVASKMAVLMDPQTDPCRDFAQYACGGFYKDAVIPDDKRSTTSYDSLDDDIKRLLRNFLSSSVEKNDMNYVKNIKRFYSTCMDEDKIEEIGYKPYSTSEYPKDWPTLNPAWDDSTFNVNDLVDKYAAQDVLPLFNFGVTMDKNNSTRHELYFSGFDSTSLPVGYYKLPRNNTVVRSLRQYYVDIAVALGAEEATARQDADDFIDLERQFAKISLTKDEMSNNSAFNNPTTLDAMAVNYPYFDWHRAVQAKFDLINHTIPNNLPVNVFTPTFFAKLEGLLSLTSQPRYKRMVQNLFGFAFAKKYVGSLTRQMREITLKYTRTRTGIEKDLPRWRQCFISTGAYFPDAVGKTFVTEMFSEDSKKYVNSIVNSLKETFSEMLRDADWMSPKTKEAAFAKIDTLVVKIGYPDKTFSYEDVEREYENYTVMNEEYYKTMRSLRVQRLMKSLSKLDKPVNTYMLNMPLWWINAYALPSNNEIGFPAGRLQPPFYSTKYPSSINYAGVGTLIGHEITHGFDQSGSQYDYQGKLKNWWQPEDFKEYKNRTQCIIDQYSAYWVDEIGMYANGKATVGEDVSDIGGLKESYKAYKSYAASQPDEIPLPGLGLTTDQQFFLASAQTRCVKDLPAYLKNRNLNNEGHSPGRLRILGPLQDNEDFARVFKCPSGSPMNPAKKCVVW